MKTKLTNYSRFLLAILLFFGLFSNTTYAVWQNVLSEDFNKDQQNDNLRWPWRTDHRNEIDWHWNPESPHFRAEGDERSNYCWGLQDFLYNRNVTRAADNQQAIWCASTNRSDTNNPRDPEEDQYMNGQNAWVWWGPSQDSSSPRRF